MSNKTIYQFTGTILLENRPCPLQDALNLLQEEGFCTASDLPEFSHGQKLFDADGDACHFIGADSDGMRAVVRYANGTLLAQHWAELEPAPVNG